MLFSITLAGKTLPREAVVVILQAVGMSPALVDRQCRDGVDPDAGISDVGVPNGTSLRSYTEC